MRYDVIVIGSGPAGLSAAITLKIRNKSVLVVGNAEVSEKVEKAHEINNYLGIPAVKGSDLAKQFLDHAKSLGVEIVNHQIHTVYAMGEFFSLQTTANETLEASAVVLATGVNFGKPYPGENEFLGRGVSYCATCDAPLYKGKKIVMIGSSKKEEAEADFMSEICSEVIYIPTYQDEVDVNENVQVVREEPVEIKGGLKAMSLATKEQEIEADGFFILRESVSPGQLVPGLAMDGNHIQVNRKMETNIRGCFACGDIVGAPYQYIKAAGEGNIAAISVVEYLNSLKK
ncbi:MAG: NAD(P)/FAD-dependent oxidoreductase [Lachnospiraceae bacterium]|jgi:thioredoxin reductase (NADPH)|nr:NAD(P)/FAD-dependent oxidoreductase [Lachnospiraceae bacterium]